MKSNTTTLNISLPRPLKSFVEEQVTAGGYTSASEYIREMIRAARRRQSMDHKLEELLLEGLDSGPGVVADDTYWAAKEKRLLERWGKLDDQ